MSHGSWNLKPLIYKSRSLFFIGLDSSILNLVDHQFSINVNKHRGTPPLVFYGSQLMQKPPIEIWEDCQPLNSGRYLRVVRWDSLFTHWSWSENSKDGDTHFVLEPISYPNTNYHLIFDYFEQLFVWMKQNGALRA